MFDTEKLSSSAYGVEFDSDKYVERMFDEGSYKDIDIEEPLERPRGHVMNKEEFMDRVRKDCAERDRKKAIAERDRKKFLENDVRSYRIERAMYQRRKAQNSRRK